MKYYLSFFLITFSWSLFAQGTVHVETSASIDKMMEKFVMDNQSEETVKGWRIQIITTDDRRNMETARGKFSALYPGVDLSWNHVAPYYRVMVGAYESKKDLMGFLLELKNDFPGVIPVMDNVKKSDLVRF